jgi:hypothetical protein
MTVIKPTVGRVVWFTPSKNDTEVIPSGTGKCAAMVTHVFHERMVNLTVFDANGKQYARTSVVLVQEGDPKPEHGYYCEWMPYQLGQAAKTECAEQVARAAREGFSSK